jgi:hypothetical protein
MSFTYVKFRTSVSFNIHRTSVKSFRHVLLRLSRYEWIENLPLPRLLGEVRLRRLRVSVPSYAIPLHLTIINVKAVATKKLSTTLTLVPSSSIHHFKETRKKERKKEDNRNLIKEFLIKYRFVETVQEILIGTN